MIPYSKQMQNPHGPVRKRGVREDPFKKETQMTNKISSDTSSISRLRNTTVAAPFLTPDPQVVAPTPGAWHGEKSDTSFLSYFEDGTWVLSMAIDGPMPIRLQTQYEAHDDLLAQAQHADFAMSMAKFPERADRETVRKNALTLAYFTGFFHHHGQTLIDAVDDASSQMDVSPESLATIRRNRAAAQSLLRISRRLNDALLTAFSQAQIHAMTAWTETPDQ